MGWQLKPLASITVCLIGLICGVLLGAAKWRGSAQSFHREARIAAILKQAEQMPKGGVVVIGDSTVEFNRFDTLCGLPALNAGIAWSTTRDWIGDDLRVIEAAKPSVVILALGTNDSGDWLPTYRQLARRTGARFAVPPRDPVKAAALRGVIPLANPVTSYGDERHPDSRGFAEWRANVEAVCKNVRQMHN